MTLKTEAYPSNRMLLHKATSYWCVYLWSPIREEVKWPSDMDPTFKSFLEGLLQKDPKQRLSWPHLLYHPFVCDGRCSPSLSSPLPPPLPSPSPLPDLDGCCVICYHRNRHPTFDAVCP